MLPLIMIALTLHMELVKNFKAPTTLFVLESWFMKKFLGIVVLGLLWCNVSFAECIKGNCTNGQGTFTWADGTVEKGIWENNELVKPN